MILILRDLKLYVFLRNYEKLKLKEDLTKQKGYLTKYAKSAAFFSNLIFILPPGF